MIRTRQRKSRRTILRRRCVALSGLLTITYFAANLCARLALEHHLRASLRCDVQIASVQIGWPDVRICGIRLSAVNSPDEPFVDIPEIQVSLTPGDGFRHGVWADEVVVTDPTLTSQFSESGELLTELPKPPPGEDEPLPLRLLKIVGGTVDC